MLDHIHDYIMDWILSTKEVPFNKLDMMHKENIATEHFEQSLEDAEYFYDSILNAHLVK